MNNQNISLCSSIMRAPQVFAQYEGVEGLARDLTIWMAWNRAPEARLNIRQFAEMFGYSHAYLFKKVNDAQKAWLKLKQFGPEVKDVIGFTLAKMFTEALIFPKAAPFVTKEGDQIQEYEGMRILRGKAYTQKSARGTSYGFYPNPDFLKNCEGGRYQAFQLNEYQELKSPTAKAWSSGRKMFLHLAWKRGVWDAAKDPEHPRHQVAQYDELLSIAGFVRRTGNAEARQAFELRQLLEDLSCFPSIQMTAEVIHNHDTGKYEVRFTRLTEVEVKKRKKAVNKGK